MSITVFKLQVVHYICENSEEDFQTFVLEVETYFINIIQLKRHEQRIYLSFVVIFQQILHVLQNNTMRDQFFLQFLDYFKIN